MKPALQVTRNRDVPVELQAPEVSFRYVGPDTAFPIGKWSSALLYALRTMGFDFEALNTKLEGADDMELQSELLSLCRMPKASTLANGAIIQAMVAAMDPAHAYVNVGVWHGFTLFCGMLRNEGKTCIGVDRFCTSEKLDGFGRARYRGATRRFHRRMDHLARRAFYQRFQRRRSANHHFFELDYASYFEHVHREPIGVYLYDAQHRYRDQLRALKLAEPFFAEGCLIFIDDANDGDNRSATFDFIDQSPYPYRVLFDRVTRGDRHPTFWNGILVLQRLA